VSRSAARQAETRKLPSPCRLRNSKIEKIGLDSGRCGSHQCHAPRLPAWAYRRAMMASTALGIQKAILARKAFLGGNPIPTRRCRCGPGDSRDLARMGSRFSTAVSWIDRGRARSSETCPPGSSEILARPWVNDQGLASINAVPRRTAQAFEQGRHRPFPCREPAVPYPGREDGGTGISQCSVPDPPIRTRVCNASD